MRKFLLFVFLLCCFHSYSQQGSVSKLNLFFDVNKYELTEKHLGIIDSLVTKNVKIFSIKGFADSSGTSFYNDELSQKRVRSVFTYLFSNQYPYPVKVESFGEQHNAGDELFYNRRVEIWFEEKKIEEPKIPEESIKIDTPAVVEKYEISNIYFLPDQPIVDPMSFFAVDDAAKYLKRFPGCKFEIIGHVNYVTPPSLANNPKALEPLQILSEERAKEIYKLLIERGVPAEAMSHKGVGNSQMVFKNPKNDSEKRKNMRVEILITCKK